MNLDKLEKLAMGATQGEWQAGRPDMMSYDDSGLCFKNIYLPDDAEGDKCTIKVMTSDPIVDSQYIAAVSPDVVLKMIQQLRAADELLQYVECYNGLGVTNCLTKNVPCGGCKAVKKYRKLRDLREEG